LKETASVEHGLTLISYANARGGVLQAARKGPQRYPRGTRQLKPGESTWAAIDHPNNRILACDAEAWRYLGWIAPDAGAFPEMLPETFGPLPV
jgi:hypothetical protein